MTKRCDIIAEKIVAVGNNVSHSHRKTRRRFLPNLQSASLRSELLGVTLKFKVAASTLRSIEHNGGLDSFLLTTSSTKLTAEAAKLKRQIKKKVEVDPKAKKPVAKKKAVSNRKAAIAKKAAPKKAPAKKAAPKKEAGTAAA